MKNNKLYYLHYRTSPGSKFFVQAVRYCKYPERTKEYKKLYNWLCSGIVQACGYCDAGYYKENTDLFIY
jgi:hypothetical protein